MIRTLVTVLLLAGPCACGDRRGEDEMAAHDASASLERQRTDVRRAARGLTLAAEQALSGTTHTSTGGFRGCESAFPEQFRDFQYLVRARVDAGPGSAASYLERLQPVLEDAGFAVEGAREEPNGFTTLVGAREDLSASFVHSGGSFVGLDVSGPCVEVPEGQREAWLRRAEPTREIR